jgi:hypothetical protein
MSDPKRIDSYLSTASDQLLKRSTEFIFASLNGKTHEQAKNFADKMGLEKIFEKYTKPMKQQNVKSEIQKKRPLCNLQMYGPFVTSTLNLIGPELKTKMVEALKNKESIKSAVHEVWQSNGKIPRYIENSIIDYFSDTLESLSKPLVESIE